ncbi:DUF2974 domain-containing protein [Acidaminobacter sp. JC074]|uniref:Mbeg1-like protein n=1 Tax=Acidaminobacter sp. JC074 TaxID=2530199 RepID=UPI001F10A37A|nr:Mbeg1-like protein [Acidaminobacter sp. JC074]MCH4886898.1 DUF2974 domain-containing protein [Acidaminobacter sp. JC074]
MTNIIDYIKWRGDLSFDLSPLNEVDNLIFSKLVYLDIDDIVAEGEMTIGQIADLYHESKGIKKLGALLNENFVKLLMIAGQSNRFKNVSVSRLVEYTCEETTIQFAAMTFKISDHISYIAFRGTDDTLVGWKEDFMMSFLETVPAQIESLKYIDMVIKNNPSSKFYVGGHSKGGNLAVYASVHTDYKDQILGIFNNDGPGFKESMTQSEKYHMVADRFHTLVPKSSVVGMLLEHEESYEVVECRYKRSGLLQHDGFTWHVVGTSFIHMPDVDGESKLMSKTIKGVLNSMTIEQREQFTNAFFDVLSTNNQKNLLDIQGGHFKSLFAMTKAYSGLDDETKKLLRDVFNMMFGEGFKNMWTRE